MRGIVKSFDSTKGYGFIYGNDESVFFHKSQVIGSIDDVVTGCEVEYSIVHTSKGEQAEKVKIIQQENRKQFIKVGNARIKISNIKNYGIAEDKEEYYSELTECMGRISEIELYLRDNPGEAYAFSLRRTFQQQLNELERRKKELERMLEEIKDFEYLYITTYQGDNYKIYQHEVEYSIKEILEILDEMLL